MRLSDDALSNSRNCSKLLMVADFVPFIYRKNTDVDVRCDRG